MFTVAYIALGSNIGDRLDHLNHAVQALAHLPLTTVAALSRVYETAPQDYTSQRSFYNAVVMVQTGLSARALLGACLGIEAGMGRRRLIKNGPRIIDLDLLAYGDMVSEDNEMSLPHPRLLERSFVLAPLCDICHDEAYSSALQQVGTDDVRVLEEFLTPV